ncbi:MAG TPA: hypothetical protein VF297_10545 [Pyrinomonadaceae bacterium]
MADHRWKEFEMRIEACRYYLNIALQTNVFFYAITGVILGFYLNKTTNEYLVYALLLPILIASILGGIFIYAAGLQKKAADTIEDIRRELRNEKSDEKRATIKEIPDLELLYILLLIFGWVFIFIGVALIVTPFLKAAPFPMWECPPTYLIVFAVAGTAVLAIAGYGTYYFARKHDKEAKERRREIMTTAA